MFLDSLEGYAAGGLRAGDGVILIATSSHLDALEGGTGRLEHLWHSFCHSEIFSLFWAYRESDSRRTHQ